MGRAPHHDRHSNGPAGDLPESKALKILVIARNPELLEFVDECLTDSGYLVLSAFNPRSAVAACRSYAPHLILLDILMEGQPTGLQVFRRLRVHAGTTRSPIVLLAGRTRGSILPPSRQISGRKILSTPFTPGTLLTRVREALRRGRTPRPQRGGLILQGLRIDLDRHDVRVGTNTVTLTETEFQVLRTLMEADGRVVTRKALVTDARGSTPAAVGRSVDFHVASIRRKLGTPGGLLETVRGYGYRLRDSGTPPGP